MFITHLEVPDIIDLTVSNTLTGVLATATELIEFDLSSGAIINSYSLPEYITPVSITYWRSQLIIASSNSRLYSTDFNTYTELSNLSPYLFKGDAVSLHGLVPRPACYWQNACLISGIENPRWTLEDKKDGHFGQINPERGNLTFFGLLTNFPNERPLGVAAQSIWIFSSSRIERKNPETGLTLDVWEGTYPDFIAAGSPESPSDWVY